MGTRHSDIDTTPTPKRQTLDCVMLDIRALAREHDVDHTTLAQIFNGTLVPSPRLATKLAKALGMSSSELYTALGETNPMPSET
jgi:hypothetical protein